MTDAPVRRRRIHAAALKPRRARTARQLRQMIVPARDAMGTAVRPAPSERVAGNVSWEEKLSAPARERSGRSAMGKLASGLVLTFAVVGSGTSAEAGPWCAFYDSSTYNCGFHSYAQCYATIYGNGGWCRQNFFEPSARDRRSGKTRPPSRY
jgi:hypothetical protein